MTSDRAALLTELLALDPEPAFHREYLDRGGHAYHFTGDPVKQDQLRTTLPLRYVTYARVMKEERQES